MKQLSKLYKAINRKFLICLLLLIASACDTNDAPPASNTPDIDLSSIGTILPTISPDDVNAYAQLADKTTLDTGQVVYEMQCAECHGINGEGQFSDAPMQRDSTGRIGAPPHNRNGHTWHHDDDLITDVILNGGRGTPDMFYPMPAFSEQLTDEEIEAVIAYIKTMWTEEQRLIQAERTLQIRQQIP